MEAKKNMEKNITEVRSYQISPSVFVSQNASTGIPGFIEEIQYLPLGDLPSLILISLQDSAASSEMEPSGAEIEKLVLFLYSCLSSLFHATNLAC